MCPQHYIPETRTQPPTPQHPHMRPKTFSRKPRQPKQCTIWDFIPLYAPEPPLAIPIQMPNHDSQSATQTQPEIINHTTNSTPVAPINLLTPTNEPPDSWEKRSTLISPDKNNDPWGDIWAA